MIGVYDFCGHYDWTFAWLDAQGGPAFLKTYWDEAIRGDSQAHAAALIQEKGFAGMQEYWGHTLTEEAAACSTALTESCFRIDMCSCPSMGFLLANELHKYRDYCDHCMGWIGPMMKQAGFRANHQHNHHGQCWWEFRKASDPGSGDLCDCYAEHDVRRTPEWNAPQAQVDTFLNANSVDDKLCAGGQL